MELFEWILEVFELILGVLHFTLLLISGAFKIFIVGPFIFIGAVSAWMIQGRKKLLWDMLQDYKNGLLGVLIIASIVSLILFTFHLC